jgi:hypothetical protein
MLADGDGEATTGRAAAAERPTVRKERGGSAAARSAEHNLPARETEFPGRKK